ncbi:MAG: TetR/AcrR family transcriptional regulator [Aquabacterium sp.]
MTSSPPAAPSPGPRRRPSQSRAQATVDVIFEATMDVLVREGAAHLTTNRIAERAGVSIGTLYQYFSTREAIIAALMAQHRAKTMAGLEAQLSKLRQAEASPREVLRAFIRIYVQTFAPADAAMRAVMHLAWQLDQHVDLAHSLREAAERVSVWLQQLHHPDIQPPNPALAFVLTRSLAGSVRSAMLEQSSLLDAPAFEAELERVCWAILSVGKSTYGVDVVSPLAECDARQFGAG